MKKQRSAAEGKANEELSASPIKKQGSAAGGKANYRIKNRITEETRLDDRQKSRCKEFRIIVPEKCSYLVPRVQLSGTKSPA